SFAQEIREIKDMREIIAQYTSDVAAKLRSQISLCQCISIFVRTSHYKDDGKHSFYKTIKLQNPTSDTFELINIALSALDDVFEFGPAYKKAGVWVSDFVSESEIQLDMFESVHAQSHVNLM